MKSLIQVLILAKIVGAATIEVQSDATFKRAGYSNTFLETFSGKKNTLPSSSTWITDLGTSYPGGAERWGNNEFQVYTNSTSNLHITAQNRLAIIPQLALDGTWTSARIETRRSDFQVKAGGKMLVEGRLKIGTAEQKYQQGIWPAFWALGSDFRGNYTNWPQASEWDLLEVVSGGNLSYFTAHCGFAPGGPCNEYNGLGNGGTLFTRGEWHTISFVVDRSMGGTWLNETINWYLDGDKKFTVSGSTVNDKPTWEKLARGPKFLLLNVAVGGNWPGPPNDMTIGGPSVGMEVDYVGVWNSV